jgi:hypothetical protein
MKTIDLLVQELPALGGFPDGAVEAGFLCSNDTLCFVNKDGDCPSEWRISMKYDVEDRWVEVTREQYEAALAAKNEGWIEWGGGKHPPVSTNTVVDVKFKNGNAQSGYPAGEYSWEHVWQDCNIIAYRLHKPQEAEQAKTDDETDLNECIGQDAAPVWNGEGLPPVGCECEFEADDGSWGIGTVLCVGKNRIFWLCHEDGDEYTSEVNLREFRPLRTEAGRKREEAIEEMIKIATMYTTKSLGLDLAFNSIYNSIAAGEIPGVKLED